MQPILEYLSSLGVSRDVAFTTMVTISIFALGFILNRIYDGLKQRNHFKTVRLFVVEYLRSLQKPMQDQVVVFQDFADKLATYQHQQWILHNDAIRSDYLKNISQVDVFRAMVFGFGGRRRKRVQSLNSAMEALDYVERLRALAFRQFDYLIETYTYYLRNWNRSLNEIQRMFDSFRSQAQRAQIPPSADPFLSELDGVIYTWQQSPDRHDMQNKLEKFIRPIKEVSIKHFDDPRAQLVIPLTLEAMAIYKDRQNLLDATSRFFREGGTKLSQRAKSITEVVDAYS